MKYGRPKIWLLNNRYFRGKTNEYHYGLWPLHIHPRSYVFVGHVQGQRNHKVIIKLFEVHRVNSINTARDDEKASLNGRLISKSSGLEDLRNNLSTSPYLVEITDYGIKSIFNEDLLVIVVPYYANGSFDDLRKKYDPTIEGVAWLITQIATIMLHHHQNGVFHGDLRASKILFDENNEIHLADYNFSWTLDGVVDEPEEVYRSGSNFKPSYKNDLFALAAISCETLLGIDFHKIRSRLMPIARPTLISKLFRRPLHDETARENWLKNALSRRFHHLTDSQRSKATKALLRALSLSTPAFTDIIEFAAAFQTAVGETSPIYRDLVCKPKHRYRKLILFIFGTVSIAIIFTVLGFSAGWVNQTSGSEPVVIAVTTPSPTIDSASTRTVTLIAALSTDALATSQAQSTANVVATSNMIAFSDAISQLTAIALAVDETATDVQSTADTHSTASVTETALVIELATANTLLLSTTPSAQGTTSTTQPTVDNVRATDQTYRDASSLTAIQTPRTTGRIDQNKYDVFIATVTINDRYMSDDALWPPSAQNSGVFTLTPEPESVIGKLDDASAWEALAYCRWLSRNEGGDAIHGRLPTYNEWKNMVELDTSADYTPYDQEWIKLHEDSADFSFALVQLVNPSQTPSGSYNPLYEGRRGVVNISFRCVILPQTGD